MSGRDIQVSPRSGLTAMFRENKMKSPSLSFLPQPAQGSELTLVRPMYIEVCYLVSKTFSLFGDLGATGRERQRRTAPAALRTSASSSLVTAGTLGLKDRGLKVRRTHTSPRLSRICCVPERGARGVSFCHCALHPAGPLWLVKPPAPVRF